IDFLAMIGIEFGADGIVRHTGGEGWLIEDCVIPKEEHATMRILTSTGDPLRHLTVRRSVLHYPAYDPDANDRVVFMELGATEDGWIESCMIGEAGWTIEAFEDDDVSCKLFIRRLGGKSDVFVDFCGDVWLKEATKDSSDE
ncbi:MAG: hypothetical protein EA377_00435, partial [Phycisphaerales bacterium]